jgi:hypothetical protein
MKWDPFTTLRNALWIGGAQWAGKSTVAGLLAERYGLTQYHYDYHDARGHEDRRTASRLRAGLSVTPRDLEACWVSSSPQEMADEALASFAERFAFVLDDLRALVSPRPIVAEGWGLRPDLVAGVTGSLRRMVVLVPTEEFRQVQLSGLSRAGTFNHPVSDPVRAQQNRVARDRLLAEDVVRRARVLDVRVIEVDGTRDAESVTDLVAGHFAEFLPSTDPVAAEPQVAPPN